MMNRVGKNVESISPRALNHGVRKLGLGNLLSEVLATRGDQVDHRNP